MNDHVDGNTVRDKMQSAYRSGHSTETALLRIKNDIDVALDRKSMVIRVMLDLSSAFDTIEHEVLLTRLEHTFGITDKALAWLRSYLSERHQNVVVDSTMSTDYVLQRPTRVSAWSSIVLHVYKTCLRYCRSSWHAVPLLCRRYTNLCNRKRSVYCGRIVED